MTDGANTENAAPTSELDEKIVTQLEVSLRNTAQVSTCVSFTLLAVLLRQHQHAARQVYPGEDQGGRRM